MPVSTSSTPRAAIITALPLECDAVLPHLIDVRQLVHPAGTIYRVGHFAGDAHRWEVAVAVAGMHNVQAALEAERVITHFNPEILLFCGVAGGLKDVTLGDVVAATKVYWYEAGKDGREFQPRPEVNDSAYALVQRAMIVASERRWHERLRSGANPPTPAALVKPIAAGGLVVASRRAESFQRLRQSFSDAVAVDMESYGFLRAAYAHPEVRALTVRGISDLIKGKAQADSEGGQPRAAAHAAAFAFQVLAEFTPAAHWSSSLTQGELSADRTVSIEQLAATLYPRGPLDAEVWSRAGGDVGQLSLTGIGRADWHAALRLLRQGGGGQTITPTSLLTIMQFDFPNHPDLGRLEVGVR